MKGFDYHLLVFHEKFKRKAVSLYIMVLSKKINKSASKVCFFALCMIAGLKKRKKNKAFSVTHSLFIVVNKLQEKWFIYYLFCPTIVSSCMPCPAIVFLFSALIFSICLLYLLSNALIAFLYCFFTSLISAFNSTLLFLINFLI